MSNSYFLQGDCRDVLRDAPDKSVHCVVTSPPYWGLRDYGLPLSVWGGDAECAHEWGNLLPPKPGRGNKPGDFSTSSLTNPARQDGVTRATNSGAFCTKCGAWRGCLGLEPTVELYIEHMVMVFREVYRVLRDDGTVWLNLGDSYSGSGKGGNPEGSPHKKQRTNAGSLTVGTRGLVGETAREAAVTNVSRRLTAEQGIRGKQLMMIPARVALALQNDGWYLRMDIVWHKPNPMPESVTDRPTKAHEYIFLLSKKARYYYDQEAISEPVSQSTYARLSQDVQNQIGSTRANGGRKANGNMKAVGRKFDPGAGNKNNPSFDAAMAIMPDKRNARSVWTITTKPFKAAHFATFPPELAARCIKAGTSEHGCCAECGAPWQREVRRTKMVVEPGPSREERTEGGRLRTQVNGTMVSPPRTETIGWNPTCKCSQEKFYYCPDCKFTEAIGNLSSGCPVCGETMIPAPCDVVPCTVLDIFGGAFTTILVANQLGRDGIGIELNPEYIEIGRKRVLSQSP